MCSSSAKFMAAEGRISSNQLFISVPQLSNIHVTVVDGNANSFSFWKFSGSVVIALNMEGNLTSEVHFFSVQSMRLCINSWTEIYSSLVSWVHLAAGAFDHIMILISSWVAPWALRENRDLSIYNFITTWQTQYATMLIYKIVLYSLSLISPSWHSVVTMVLIIQ